jgi:YD repeat-containing protein
MAGRWSPGLTWDANGNLTSDGVRSYSYDHSNRLTQVTEGSLTTQFAYNGDGIRTSKTVAGDTTQYVLDLAATLPVVISDTQAVYLYGLDILARHHMGRDSAPPESAAKEMQSPPRPILPHRRTGVAQGLVVCASAHRGREVQSHWGLAGGLEGEGRIHGVASLVAGIPWVPREVGRLRELCYIE